MIGRMLVRVHASANSMFDMSGDIAALQLA